MKTTFKKRLLASLLCGAMAVSLAACSSNTPADTSGDTAGDTADTGNAGAVTINVGYENATTEPISQAVERWEQLVEEESGGSIQMELFPNSTLGKKNDLIDQMLMGENIITIADGAFLADYGVPDFGIFYAPYAFENWDEVWAVVESDWYKDLCDQLAANSGLRVLSSNWMYGARDILSIKEVRTPEDLAGLKLRVSSNDLSVTSFESLGATPVGMDLADVYQAMSGGTIDAFENPIYCMYNRSFQEVAKHLVKNEHILATSMWICGESFFSTLTEEQQQILMDCADEAGLYNNEMIDEADAEAEQAMKEAGVTVIELTDEEKAQWVEAAQPFFEEGAATLGWSDGLYDTVREIATSAAN